MARIEKTFWRILRATMSSKHRHRRNTEPRVTVETSELDIAASWIKSISSISTQMNFDKEERSTINTAHSLITSITSESVRKNYLFNEEPSSLETASSEITNVTSNLVGFHSDNTKDESVFDTASANIIYVNSSEI